MALYTGQILNNRYQIASQLAAGGFGTVYKAWDRNLNHTCAVKENLESTADAQRQFAFEANVLVKLRHPNLPAVFDHFIIPGQGQYIVMDFIEGDDLENLRCGQGGALAEAQVLPWIGQICDALSYMHSQEPAIIHRDIKPANIRITPQGKAVLVDFGIAKENRFGKATTGSAKGVTPGYSPPEQYTGAGTNERSDIYSLGATLYTLLTGVELPESIHRMLRQNKTQPPHLLRPNISLPVSMAIMQAIQPDPSFRFATINEFKACLFGKRRKEPSRWLVKAALYAGLILALLATGIFMGRRILPPVTATQAPTVTNSQIVVTQPVSGKPTSLLSTSANPSPPPPTSEPIKTILPSSTPTTKPTEAALTIRDESGTTMVRIPAGTFSMGGNVPIALNECVKLYPGGACDGKDYADEEPAHLVMLDSYLIDQTEVTNAMYARCVADGACQPPSKNRSNMVSSYYGSLNYANYPVIYISWSDAQTYCQWRGARLPTEAEWEKAARGTNELLYPWGNEFIGSLANFCDSKCELEWANHDFSDGYADTAPVGSYPQGASVYGVLDLAGNVWEWTSDWYGASYFYNDESRDNPHGPSSGSQRVIKGGAWNCVGSILRGGTREKEDPNGNFYNIGFRCAVSQ